MPTKKPELKPEVKAAIAKLLDETTPWDQRRHYLFHLCAHDGHETQQALKAVLDRAAATNGETLWAEKVRQYNELIETMQSGPLRSATFITMLPGEGAVRRARVALQDGEVAYMVVPDDELAAALARGDQVLIEPQGKSVLARDPLGTTAGELARFERPVGADRVEVVVRDHDHQLFMVAEPLRKKLAAGEVPPGSQLLVDSRRLMAFEVLPAPDGLSHYWFLDRRPVPDVIVQRDIGAPPAYIAALTRHLRIEMTMPKLARRYHQRRVRMKLLAGVSGSGKTLSMDGFNREMYGLMSEVTGVPIEQLPPRVLRLSLAEILSKWYGESEQRLKRFFDEVEQLADERFTAPDGKVYELPVLVMFEEIDALARTRGTGEVITERVQTTALERLDANSARLRNRLVIFLLSTNVPGLVDPAFLRRAGGTTERFGRLGRRGFAAVLEKHLRDLPFVSEYGPQARAERRVLNAVTDWLFSRNGDDEGQFTVTYAGSTTPQTCYRRDLLTGALADRAVQQAASEACHAEYEGCEGPGLTTEMLIDAFDQQISSIVDQLTRENVGNYATLPDGVRVAELRRLEQPPVLPFELITTS